MKVCKLLKYSAMGEQQLHKQKNGFTSSSHSNLSEHIT